MLDGTRHTCPLPDADRDYNGPLEYLLYGRAQISPLNLCMSSHLQHLRNFGRRVAQISVVATGGLGIDQEWDEWDGPLLAVVLLLLAAPLLRILWLGQINSVCFRLFICWFFLLLNLFHK